MVRSLVHRSLVLVLIAAAAHAPAPAQEPRTKVNPATAAKTRAAQSTAVSQDVQDRLIAREKDLAAAQQRHAVAVIDEALADDFHELASDGRLYAKSEVMPMLKDVIIDDFSLSDFKVFPIDADSAIVTYGSTVKGNYKGQTFSPKNALSSVWVRRHGSWQIVFHQTTPIPAKAD